MMTSNYEAAAVCFLLYIGKDMKLAWEDINNAKLYHKLSPLAVIFMFTTGMRAGEVCALRYDDIYSGYIHVQRTVVRDLNNIKEQTKGVEGDRWHKVENKSLQLESTKAWTRTQAISKHCKRQMECNTANGTYSFRYDYDSSQRSSL